MSLSQILMGRFEYEEWSCEGRVVGAGGGAGTGTGTGAGIGIGAGVGVGAGVGGIWSAHRSTTTIHFASRIGNWGSGHLQLRFSGKRKRHSFRTSQYVSGTLLGKLAAALQCWQTHTLWAALGRTCSLDDIIQVYPTLCEGRGSEKLAKLAFVSYPRVWYETYGLQPERRR